MFNFLSKDELTILKQLSTTGTCQFTTSQEAIAAYALQERGLVQVYDLKKQHSSMSTGLDFFGKVCIIPLV